MIIALGTVFSGETTSSEGTVAASMPTKVQKVMAKAEANTATGLPLPG